MAMKMYTSVEEHLNSFPKEKREILEKIRKTIMSIIPNASEVISYGIPTYKLNGKTIVHFSGYDSHIGFYPSPNGMKEFEKELMPYASGKGTAKFKWDEPIPLDLIKKIVKFRLEETQTST